jgi:pyruvate dehydrogenase E1 component alpha subunit
MISNKKKIQLYKELVRIRFIEQTIAKRYSEQKMRCPVHLSIGQEAVAVGICSNLKKEDKVFTAHRSHAHYLAKGGSLAKMIAELYGKFNGCAKGKGGSMHLIDIDAGV